MKSIVSRATLLRYKPFVRGVFKAEHIVQLYINNKFRIGGRFRCYR